MSDLYWLTDEQMARLRPHFPKSHGKPRVDDRRVLSGIIFVNRNGLRWRDAPPVYGPHKTLYNRWKRWSEAGVFIRMMEGLSGAQAERRTVMIDATYLKAHRTASSLVVKTYGSPLTVSLVPHDRGSLEDGAKVMDISVLGIDLGKNSCSVVGLDLTGKVVVRRRMRRETVITYAAALPHCVVAMEACCGAHHMGRALARQGHTVRLMSPEYVRPYVKAQKNDDRDAEAIAEAATRPTMRFVELKTEEQLDMQTLHRIRDQLVGDRTSLMNQIRSLLLERGHIVPQGRAKLAARLGEMLDDSAPVLGPRIHRLVSDMRLRWIALDERIGDLDAEFADAARTDARTRRLLTIPGIGALNATALVAAVGDARTFGRGRDLAAWLGLVPRQATTGGKPRLLGITKRGSRYLRKNLIQGARASLPIMSKSDTRLGAWLRGLLSRSHPNTVVVALAAKMARIVWALLRHERDYDPIALAA